MKRQLFAGVVLAVASALSGCGSDTVAQAFGLAPKKAEVQVVTVEQAPPQLAPECTAANPREPTMDDSKDANGIQVLGYIRAQKGAIRKLAGMRSVCAASIEADERRRDAAKQKPTG